MREHTHTNSETPIYMCVHTYMDTYAHTWTGSMKPLGCPQPCSCALFKQGTALHCCGINAWATELFPGCRLSDCVSRGFSAMGFFAHGEFNSPSRLPRPLPSILFPNSLSILFTSFRAMRTIHSYFINCLFFIGLSGTSPTR